MKHSEFQMDTISLDLEKRTIDSLHRISEASWGKQEEYDREDVRWGFSCLVGVYANWLGRIRVETLIDSYNHLVRMGNYLSAILIFRAIVESYILLHYLRGLIDSFGKSPKDDEMTELNDNLNKLIYGVRYKFPYPWGGEIEYKSLNILTAIEKIKGDNPIIEEDYFFLSNFCHPNNYPTSFIVLSHPDATGYPTDKMIEWQLETGGRIKKIQKYVIEGIKEDMAIISKYCIDNLEKIKKD